MSLQKFDIIFDNQGGIYYGGQIVTGRVVVNTTKEKKIRGICLHLKGEAEVNWSESRRVSHNGKRRSESVHYRSHELYVNMETWLVGASNGDMILLPGEYVYPFACNLPFNIPSSFEGVYGYVRYTIKVKIDRPWKFDHQAKVGFTVLSIVDLNLEQNILEPTKTSEEKYLCCCCCRSGPVTLVVNVFRGYVPGQHIEAVIECDNISRQEVDVKCYLQKIVSFHGYHLNRMKTKEDENMVAVERLGSVGPNASLTWTSKLAVPPLPASYLKYCNCIDISYQFVVKGRISGPHRNIYASVPIIIGNIPLVNYFSSIIPSAPPEDPSRKDLPPTFDDAVATSQSPPPEFRIPYPDMPPPTYEECVSSIGNICDEEDGEYVFGAKHFAPRYPLYTFK